MNQPSLTPQPPFPDPTISQMIVDRVDLHVAIDALLREFHQHNAGLLLRPTLRSSVWGELYIGIEACFNETSGSCDMGDARFSLSQLRDGIRKLLVPFAKKYNQATLTLTFDYIQCEAQATVHLQF
jgi:hypothetical protein